MSIIQDKISELRYLKRQNLDNEARIVGNYYRDLIRSYGIDCIYNKLDLSEFQNFKKIIDRNTILKQAYGYNITPDYSMSAHMLTYMEVEQDIFQLNKYGLNPNLDVNFYFENNDFACALATKTGQYKEYPIKETEITCEVPECNDYYEEYANDINPQTKKPNKHYISANIFPYELGLGYNENYYCENLSGKLNATIDSYKLDKETTIICRPYEHTDFNVKFNTNDDLYKCLKYKIENDDYLETLLYLTYKVSKIQVGEKLAQLNKLFLSKINDIYSIKNVLMNLYRYLNSQDIKINFNKVHSLNEIITCINKFEKYLDIQETTNISNINQVKNALKIVHDKAKNLTIYKPEYKYLLTGKLHGSVLFYDINELGKYVEKIHPNVGDLITIDFPDENNREMYEITDCYDKQLTQDGISPLLHKYIWKCKARRYTNSYEDGIETNEADNRLQEKIDYQSQVLEETAKNISIYENNEDAAYGGYELHKESTKNYDKQDVRNIEHVKYEGIPHGQLINIHKFKCGSRLCTDGYELLFETTDNELYIVSKLDHELIVKGAVFESGLKWLKATKNQVCFVNIEGTSFKLAFNTNNENEMNLDDLLNSTVDTGNINSELDNAIKFKGCKTYMFATNNELFVKLESKNTLIRLV